MKAVVYENYGSPEVLKLSDVERPSPGSNEVLLKVRAASVNSWDWDLLRGKPLLVRLDGGIGKPRINILGADVAGVVESIGDNVKRVKPGDAVFGDLCESGWGSFAEFVCAHENSLTLKPSSLKFEEVAALPQAGAMAMHAIRGYKELGARDNVLINGAAGGVGTYAVQLTKLAGAEVTGVDSAQKLDLLLNLGADHVIDYKQQDFTRNGKQYDLIVDVVASHSVFDYKRALRPGGYYVMIGGTSSSIFQCMTLGPLVSLLGSRQLRILRHKPNKAIDELKDLLASGKIKSVIGKYYNLNEVPEALESIGKGNAIGKIVIQVAG